MDSQGIGSGAIFSSAAHTDLGSRSALAGLPVGHIPDAHQHMGETRTPQGNVQSFLESITPEVNMRLVQGSSIRRASVPDVAVPYFSLDDFWSSMEEWSCYGAGVPLTLEKGEHAVQYFTPYLSGMQLFTREEPSCNGDPESRNESDWSDPDFQDSGSDSSESNDWLHARLFESAAASDMGVASPWSTSDDSQDEEDFMSIISEEREFLREAHELLEQRAVSGLNTSPGTCMDCEGGNLCFQFFECERPHLRMPFCEKIRELSSKHPAIKNLRSYELHPSSWIAIAWYPLYMIPSSLSLKDLGTSFLTFHGLSSHLPPPADTCPRCKAEFWATPVMVDQTSYPTNAEELFASFVEGAAGHSGVDELGETRAEEGPGLAMPLTKAKVAPFGMCGYKAKSSIWSDLRRFDDLKASAESWVKQMGVKHPDFFFFSGQSYM